MCATATPRFDSSLTKTAKKTICQHLWQAKQNTTRRLTRIEQKVISVGFVSAVYSKTVLSKSLERNFLVFCLDDHVKFLGPKDSSKKFHLNIWRFCKQEWIIILRLKFLQQLQTARPVIEVAESVYLQVITGTHGLSQTWQNLVKIPELVGPDFLAAFGQWRQNVSVFCRFWEFLDFQSPNIRLLANSDRFCSDSCLWWHQRSVQLRKGWWEKKYKTGILEDSPMIRCCSKAGTRQWNSSFSWP